MKDEARQRFLETFQRHARDLHADSRPEPDDEEEDAEEERPPLPEEDVRKRRLARDEILRAWREYVNVIGPDLWSDFEKWVRYRAGDLHIHQSRGVFTPEWQAVIDKYGEDAILAFDLLKEEAKEQDVERFPGDSDGKVKYEPTLHGQPWRSYSGPGFGGGGSAYPPAGAELRGIGKTIGGTGTIRWGNHPGGQYDRRDGVLRMNESGIDWADKKIFRKQVYGFIPWGRLSAFASKGRWTIAGDETEDGKRTVVEFEGDNEQDAIKMYSVARLALPGPEYSNRWRMIPGQTWAAFGPRWGEHWWVWRSFEGDWILRYLFEKDRHLM